MSLTTLTRAGRRRAPKKPAPVQGPTPVEVPLAADTIHRNLVSTASGVTAWFILAPQRWSFLSAGERGGVLDRATLRWADLEGHRVHVRQTAHPLPYTAWAEKLHNNSPHRLADVLGAESWADYLEAGQRAIGRARAETPTTYIGVQVTTKRVKDEYLPLLLDSVAVVPDEIAQIRKDLRRITESVRKEGFGARPVSSRGLGWLMHASLALGIPVDTRALASDTDHGWSRDDMAVFTEPVYAAAAPYSPTVRIRALRGGVQHERHVAVMSVERIEKRDPLNPARWPWMAYSQQLPCDSEWSAIFDVTDGRSMERPAERTRQRAEGLDEHYREHHLNPPRVVGRGIEDARRIEDEVTTAPREIACRLVGPIRLAVWGHSEEDAMSNVRNAIDAFAKDEKVTLHHGFGQFALYREFTPGESPTITSHTRVIPAYFMATAVPNASTSLGDNTGPYLGISGRSAVMLDPTWGPRNNHSGLGFYIAGLGGGKSTLAGIIMESAVRRGHQTIAFDPAGPLARLCKLLYLEKDARHAELSGAAHGTFSPYLLVPEPNRNLFQNPKEHRAAVADADLERRELMIDTILMALPGRLVTENAAVQGVVEDAVNMGGGAYGTNPWVVVDALRKFGELGGIIADRMKAAGESWLALVFPDQDETEPVDIDFDTTLTVLTMRGVAVPPKNTPREFWTRQEQRSAPLMHLASRKAARAMYANTDPKVIITDEAPILNSGGAASFRSFTLRSSRDTRKTNTHFGILTQNPGALLEIDPEVANLAGMCAVGHMVSEEVAIASLPFLGAPKGHGYEKTLMAFPSGKEPRRRFILRDYSGQVGVVDIDRDYRPHMAEVLDTTPGGDIDTDDDWAVEA